MKLENKTLRYNIESVFDQKREVANLDTTLEQFLARLDSGELRSAEPSPDGWRVNAWVKKGILLLFRAGTIVDYSIDKNFQFYDKHNIPLKQIPTDGSVRIVPGGSAVRSGSFLGAGVVMMPPAYVNIGAYVGANSMIDSHALVGSCAQIGENVHLSAAAQVGGVLEPIGALPVIIEDSVMVGGNCGIYEGTIVSKNAVIGAGVVLTRSTPLYDCVNEKIIRASEGEPLTVPENAVVVPGTRPVNQPFAREHQLSIQTPIIIKYKDDSTSAATALEDALR